MSGAVLDMADDRLLVVVGPCSVHDPVAAMDYARQLAELRRSLEDELLIVMRVYFEKPRTVTGWKGLINDPGLNGSYDVHRGLRTARKLLLDVVELGLPVGCEWLDPVTPQYIADAVAWGAIGARTTESQVHRQLASGLSMPVGFKNGTDGDVQVAIDACRAAAAQHTFFGVTPAGAAAVVTTAGNSECHIILRGGRSGPNYYPGDVSAALDAVTKAKLPRRLMVDASHGNSEKDHRRQAVVADALADQIASGEQGIVGVMLESFIQAGQARRRAIRPRWSTVRALPTRAWTSAPPRRSSTGSRPRSAAAVDVHLGGVRRLAPRPPDRARAGVAAGGPASPYTERTSSRASGRVSRIRLTAAPRDVPAQCGGRWWRMCS